MPEARKLLREIEALRAGKANVRARQLIALAISIGRIEVNRGKEPTYEKPGRPPLTIPNHSRGMSPHTVMSILNFLEADVFAAMDTQEQSDD